jgi:PASTA domain-containing protein
MRFARSAVASVAVAAALGGCGQGASTTASHGALTDRELSELTAAAHSSAAFRRRQLRAGTVRVPPVVGRQFQTAVRAIRAAGLNHKSQGFSGSVGEPSYSGRCLRVSTQAPVPGTKVVRGSTVSIMYGGCGKHRYETGLHP